MSLQIKSFLRMAILFSLLVIIVCTSITIFLIKEHRKQVKDTFSSETAFIAKQSERLIIWDDRLALKTLITQQLQSHSIINYIFISHAGRPYIHTFQGGVPKVLLTLPYSNGSRPTLTTIQSNQGEILYDISASIGQSDSILHIGLCRNEIDRQLTVQLFILVALGILVLVIGLYMSHGIAVITVREVDKMTETLMEKTTSIENLNKEVAKRLRAEQELQSLNIELKSTVDKLMVANREINDYVHLTAHELKTPLRGIGTLAQWILTDYSDKFDEHGQEQVKFLVQRAARISTLIDSILQYSRIVRTIEKEQEVDLNALLTEIISAIEQPENIQITVENNLPAVICEKAHMMQVFWNLLNNAVTYIDKPQGRVSIGCIEENGFWKFNVTDNGTGIEEKYFEKIFKVFQTLPRHEESESIGIGLAIAKKVVELYGGQIWVESKPGKGSIFFFTLPKQETGVNRALLYANTTGKSGDTILISPY